MTTFIDRTLAETKEAVLSLRDGGSWRRLAKQTGVKHATLYAIGNGQWDHVSWDTVRLVRSRIGLSDPGLTVVTLCCPSCGAVHGEGLDCHGRPVAAVVALAPGERVTAERKPRKPRRRTVSVSGATAEQRQQRAELGATWADVVTAGLAALAESEPA